MDLFDGNPGENDLALIKSDIGLFAQSFLKLEDDNHFYKFHCIYFIILFVLRIRFSPSRDYIIDMN
jgi:hypothetical protein